MNAFLHRLDRSGREFVFAIAAMLCVIGSVVAQSAVAQTADVDPPGRVARIAEIDGQAWLYSPDAGEWIAADRNRPVTTGDRIATDPGARVELDLGSTTLRLDSGSELEVLNLDDRQVALQLHDGSAALRIRDAQAVGEFEMTTDEGRFRVQAAGRYRIDRVDQASELTVYAGQAIYEGPGNALTVQSGQRGEFWIEANGNAQYSITEPVRDAFASWNDARDRNQDRVATVPRYVSPEMTGAQDLDRYGSWEQNPDYGPVWFPRGVASGWAPYSSGHWAWVQPWGWTWVDDAPWGFAPFHYGRWVYLRNSWCWAPGRYAARPVYAPALVAWVGGARANVSVSIGGRGPAVGWFPLGPREVYVPGYRVSSRYVRAINVTHITNVTVIDNAVRHPPRDYANRRYPHAMTVVPTSVLTNRQPVGPSAARLRDLPPVRALVNEPARAGAVRVAPVAAPPRAQRGVDARPFPAPPGRVGGRGEPGRIARPPLNAAEQAQHGPAERAPGARPPAAVPGAAPQGTAGTAALPGGRGSLDRRGGAVVPSAPAAQPAGVAPPVPIRPAAAPPTPALPSPAPAVRAVPPPPGQAGAERGEGAKRRIPGGEREDRRVAPREQVPEAVQRPSPAPRPAPVPRAVPEQRAPVEQQGAPEQRGAPTHRGGPERRGAPEPRTAPEQRAAPTPRAMPEQRPAPTRNVAPEAPHVAVPAPPRIAPRPVHVEPPRPSVKEGQRPPAAEPRAAEPRSQRPEAGAGRDDRPGGERSR